MAHRGARSITGLVAASLIVACLLLGPLATPASAAAPPVPTDLAAVTSPPNGNTTFTWTLSPGANGHRLMCESQGQDDIGWSETIPAASATLRLGAGVWLCDVSAYSAGLEYSARSPGVIVTIAPIPAPTGVTATAYSGEVTVSWDNPGGVHINGWIVTSTPPTVTNYVWDLTSSSTVFAGLPLNVPHTFTVTPFRTTQAFQPQYGLLSTTSAPVSVLPTPSAPTVTGVDMGFHHMTVSWTPPTSNGGSPLTGYRIVATRGEYEPLIFDVPASLTSVRIDGVDDIPGLDEPSISPSQEFVTVGVRAKNVNGYGPTGPWGDVPVWSLDPASPVGNLFVQVPDSSSVLVDWDAPTYIPGEIGAHDYSIEIDGPVDYDGESFDQTQHAVAADLPDGFYEARVRIQGGLTKAHWASRWFAVGDPCDAAFPDVTGPPFCTHISWLVRQGITTGFADGTFKPAQNVSRQAMAAFIYRTKGSPRGADPTCTVAPFPDVPASSQFCGVIDWMVDEGITLGFPDGGFHPTASVSRQSTAAFLYRAGSQTSPHPVGACSVAPYPDVPVDHPFCGYIHWLSDAGITTGFADGTFRPTQPVTRQSMAAFLSRWHP